MTSSDKYQNETDGEVLGRIDPPVTLQHLSSWSFCWAKVMEGGAVSLTTVSKEKPGIQSPRQGTWRRFSGLARRPCVSGQSWKEPLCTAVLPSTRETSQQAAAASAPSAPPCTSVSGTAQQQTQVWPFWHGPGISHHFGQKEEPVPAFCPLRGAVKTGSALRTSHMAGCILRVHQGMHPAACGHCPCTSHSGCRCSYQTLSYSFWPCPCPLAAPCSRCQNNTSDKPSAIHSRRVYCNGRERKEGKCIFSYSCRNVVYCRYK